MRVTLTSSSMMHLRKDRQSDMRVLERETNPQYHDQSVTPSMALAARLGDGQNKIPRKAQIRLVQEENPSPGLEQKERKHR